MGQRCDNADLVCTYICAYTAIVDYEWDAGKEATNYLRHGIHFADA